MSDLPEGWTSAKLGELTTKIGSGATPRGGSDVYHTSGVPLIRSMNVHFGGFKPDGLVFLNEAQAEALRSVTVKAGDVLLNITGASIGRVTTAPKSLEGARVNQHVAIIRTKPGVNSAYIAYFLASPALQGHIFAAEYGVTRQALTKAQISDLNIPLAPLNEQKRIADKLDSLLAKVDACRDRLHCVPQILKRFRQSVLAAACSGRLSDGERSEWRSAVLEEVCEPGRLITYGVIKLGEHFPGGVPCLRTSDVRWLRIDCETTKLIDPSISLGYSRTILRGGEVLVNVRGTLGGVAVVLPACPAGTSPERWQLFQPTRAI